MRWFLLYILTIYLVNLGFSVVPLVDLGFGLFSPMAIFVGVIFVVRDFAQRALGHTVLVGMLIGCALSFFLADPRVALASVISFMISEVIDWLIYSLSGKPFYKRVLFSSLLAAPIDTLVFLSLIELSSWPTFVMMVVCKLLAAFGIYYYGTRYKEPVTQTNPL